MAVGDVVVDSGRDDGPQRVVVVGASAGGLEALTELLGATEPGTGAAFVLAQHLAPSHPSLLVELLKPATHLEVRVADDGAPLESDVVLVAPPDRDVSITSDGLRVADPGSRPGPRPSIDQLFSSAADVWGEDCVALILSGTGSDGADGLRVVRSAGGVTMVQDPDSARFPGMPAAALSMGAVDVVASAQDLGQHLSRLHEHGRQHLVHAPSPLDAETVRGILTQVRRSVGIDFSGYKQTTLRRQIERRMALMGCSSPDDYFALVAADRDEAKHLADNILVTVTSFFRDSEAFDALRQPLSAMLSERPADAQIRVWVPGCATGEEAYSLGMLISDLLGHPSDLGERLKIFGTDLDEASIAVARRARYPISQRERIPQAYRERFTVEQEDTFVIDEGLRACTVFAQHDVIEDPPFPKMDLISCRNTLIYFTAPVQRRVINLLAYALAPGGILFLGKAETLETGDDVFTPVDAPWRIFSRSAAPAERPLYPSTGTMGRFSRPVGPGYRLPIAMPPSSLTHDDLLEALVRSMDHPLMVVDDDLDLLEVIGDVSPFCRIPEGQVTTVVTSLLRPELQDSARALLLLSRSNQAPVAGVPQALGDQPDAVRLHVRPIQASGRTLQVLSFEVGARVEEASSVVGEVGSSELVRQLERTLLDNQQTLRRSMTELQATNEELEASSEELQAASEELQAANEELESSNEELQATNEELGTLNQELRTRSEQMARLNEALENIQTSVDQGMVIVDSQGDVERFSPHAVRLFSMLEADIGTALSAVPTSMPIPGLDAAVSSVLGGGPSQALEAMSDDRAFLVQVHPYVDSQGAINGAIVTMTDISEMVALRSTLKDTIAQLRSQEVLLREQATYDSVTGLLNRTGFTDAVARAMARAHRRERQLALIWVDIDRFKDINDSLGHDAGDAALRACAERMEGVLRDADVIGRLGGDEFGVVISDYDNAMELDAIAERLVTALREPLSYRGRDVRLSGSLGVAIAPDDAGDPDEFLRAADAAMYAAKHAGGDQHAYFDASMNAAAEERRSLRERLTSAIRDHEFVLHYQPIVRVARGEIWGFEGLLRWQRDGTCVSASDFVPFAEESGQMRELGMETLRLMRDDLAALQEAGCGQYAVSINMSVIQLEDRLLADLVNHWPTPGGLKGVTVEVLESAFLPTRPHALQMIRELADLGARIAVDDYGSGFSNMALLANLSPDFLKLDRSFLTMPTDIPLRRALLSSAVELARVVGAEVIAEGIENAEDEQLVADVGVDLVQGFHVAEPMPLDQLVDWVAAQESRR